MKRVAAGVFLVLLMATGLSAAFSGEHEGACVHSTWDAIYGHACVNDEGVMELTSGATTHYHDQVADTTTANPLACFTTGGGDGVPYPWALPTDSCAPRDPVCVEDATKPHAVLMYAVTDSDADRYEDVADAWRDALRVANSLYAYEAARLGYEFDFRVLCEQGHIVVEHEVFDPSTGTNSLVNQLRDRGYEERHVRYWILWDDLSGRSSGTLYRDDRLSADNMNRLATGYAFVLGFPDAFTLAHEIGHTLGAVQESSPHSTGRFGTGHCTDGQDIMCYDDRDEWDHQTPAGLQALAKEYATNPFLHAKCPDRKHVDCGNDDYFHPNPGPENYLATHWNLAHPLNHFVQVEPQSA